MSYRHKRVQRVRRLVARRSVRQSEGCVIVEGAKLLDVAMDAGVRVESVYLDPDLLRPEDSVAKRALGRASTAGARVYELDEGVLARIADTVTPQPVLAVVEASERSLQALCSERPDLLVVLVDVRDPGNAGAVVRAAEAAGAGGVVCCAGSADLSSPKAVRASAGAVFHLPVVAAGDPVVVLGQLSESGLKCVGAEVRGGVDYTTVDFTDRVAIVVGNEAHGLPEEVAEGLDAKVTIPMAGHSESLNVGMAAAVLTFEVARQRRLAGHHRVESGAPA